MRIAALVLQAAIVTMASACVPAPQRLTIFESSSGAQLDDFDEALRISAKSDLACNGFVSLGWVPTEAGPRGASHFRTADGCGKRALYTQSCNDAWRWEGDQELITTTCAPRLFIVSTLPRREPSKSQGPDETR